VIAAITGATVAKVESFLIDVAGGDPDGGTSPVEMGWAFNWFGGRAMVCVADFAEPFSGPPLIGWLDSLSPLWRRANPLIIAIEDLGEDHPHWVACWGPCICDSLSEGKWLPLAGSEHRRSFVSHAHTISPPPTVCGPVKLG
jgi:hypothetical protein